MLEILFSSLESFINSSKSDIEKGKKRIHVVRPILITILNNNISLAKLLKNEFYNQFFINEIIVWSAENPDFFKALFSKMGEEGFSTGKIPWSVFKGVKNELRKEENKELYFFVTKYFFDNYESNEEVSSYVFTVQEYKDLIKYF